MDESASLRLRIYFSDFFGVKPEVIEEYGAFNISLINDLPLFIDPFLLFNSEKEEYLALHKEIIRHVQFLGEMAKRGLSAALIDAWFRFPRSSKIGSGTALLVTEAMG